MEIVQCAYPRARSVPPSQKTHHTHNTQLAISTAQQSYSSPQREIFPLSEKGFYKSIQNAYSTPGRSQPGFGSGLSGHPPFLRALAGRGQGSGREVNSTRKTGQRRSPPLDEAETTTEALVPSYFRARFFPYGKVCRFARSPSKSRPSSQLRSVSPSDRAQR